MHAAESTTAQRLASNDSVLVAAMALSSRNDETSLHGCKHERRGIPSKSAVHFLLATRIASGTGIEGPVFVIEGRKVVASMSLRQQLYC